MRPISRIGDRGCRALAKVVREGGLPALEHLEVPTGAATQAGLDELTVRALARRGVESAALCVE